MSKNKPSRPVRTPWPNKRGKEPVAFMFQPAEYEIVPPERLSEWETLLRDSVGFPANVVRSLAAARMLYTLSFHQGTTID